MSSLLLILFYFIQSYAEDRPNAYADQPASAPILALSHYRPIYFLAGSPHSKIELSFKTQIFSTQPIYFAYTQLMLWDIFNSSPFFYDLNYNPLFFYRLTLQEKKKQWLDFIPLEHESNGRGSQGEISWNRVAAQFHSSSILGIESDDTIFNFNFKAWYPFDYTDQNKDLPRYRGIWQMELGLEGFLSKRFDFNDIVLRFYPGGKSYLDPSKGGQELTFRLQAKSFSFLPLFVAQIFHGYGESLQSYRLNRWELRGGIGF